MDNLKELKKNLEKQIEEINKKNDISPTELDRVGKAIDIIKDIETICAMKEYGYEQEEPEYSERYPYSRPYYMRSRDTWEGGSSYRRGEPMGRYTDRNSYGMIPYYDYSGHNSKEDIRMDLREMMNKATSEKERMTIQTFLDQWRD